MTRTFAIAAILSLTAIAANAEPLEVQVHDAAVKVCAARHVESQPAFFYDTLTKNCVERLTSVTLHKLADDAHAKMLASTASAN